MAFKKIENYVTFADLIIQATIDKNRTLQFLRQLDEAIDWGHIETVILQYYDIGRSQEGDRAYSPLMLFKALLLQKWFQISSDPELESQINDRISFKSFLKIPMDHPSPDHSTFSRFRSRLSKEAMMKINSALLNQFHQQGLSINKGVAVDARLVKSASSPLPTEKLDELRKKQDVPESKLDKNGKPKNFPVILSRIGQSKMISLILV